MASDHWVVTTLLRKGSISPPMIFSARTRTTAIRLILMEITSIPRSDPIPPRNSIKAGWQDHQCSPAPTYSTPEESFNQDMAATVEKTMKKYADNLMCFLEGISSRLSQLELYCYNLDKSIGEIRFDLVHDHGEADSKLKSL
ncbi:hypothetical protein ACSBR2_027477 [Camellia fascicularis]